MRNGELAMLWSSFGEEGYACGVCYSSNGIKGPWKHQEEPIFKKDGGHGMIFLFNGKTYLSLHCPNEPHMMERPHFYEIIEKDGRLQIK